MKYGLTGSKYYFYTRGDNIFSVHKSMRMALGIGWEYEKKSTELKDKIPKDTSIININTIDNLVWCGILVIKGHKSVDCTENLIEVINALRPYILNDLTVTYYFDEITIEDETTSRSVADKILKGYRGNRLDLMVNSHYIISVNDIEFASIHNGKFSSIITNFSEVAVALTGRQIQDIAWYNNGYTEEIFEKPDKFQVPHRRI
jgi:hypothetical protein